MKTYIINEIIKSYSNHQKDKSTSFYYYRDSQQNEIYLVILKDGKLITLECKNEKQYSSKDIKSPNIFMNSHYHLKNKAIISTCKSVYPIGDGCYLLTVTSI